MSAQTVDMAEKRAHPGDAAEASSDPTTLPTGSSHAENIILITKGLEQLTLEDPTRYAASTRSPAVTPTLSGLSTPKCFYLSPLSSNLLPQRGTWPLIEILTNPTHSRIPSLDLVSVQVAPSGTRSSLQSQENRSGGERRDPPSRRIHHRRPGILPGNAFHSHNPQKGGNRGYRRW